MKTDLLTNAIVKDDAIRLVSQKFKKNLKPLCSSSNEDENELNEPDYNNEEKTN